MNNNNNDKVAYAMLEEKFDTVFIDKEGRVFGCFSISNDLEWVSKRILGVIGMEFSICYEDNEEDYVKYEIDKTLEKIMKVNSDIDGNNEYNIKKEEFNIGYSKLKEITDEMLNSYGDYDYMEYPGYSDYLNDK